MNCDTARIYSGAVADGELEVVPPAVLEHIRACHDCATEVEWQREAQRATVAALAAEDAEDAEDAEGSRQRMGAPWWRRRPLALVAMAAAVAAIAGTAIFSGLQRPAVDLTANADSAMGEAAQAYGQSAAFASTDGAAIAGWSNGRGMPVEVMALPGQVATGARVSRVSGHAVVTIIYAGSHGTTEVTVVPASMAGSWPAMEATRVGARPVGLVRRPGDGLIIVSPDEAGLHQAMIALEL